MTLAITRTELEAAVGADRLVTVPAGRLHPVVTHEASRAFLTEVGLVDAGLRFAVDKGLADGGTTGAEFGSIILEDLTEPPAERLLLLGRFGTDGVFLDGADGRVWASNDGTEEFAFLNSRVDLFVRCTAALVRDWPLLGLDSTDRVRRAAGDNLTVELRALDPEAFDRPGAYWPWTIRDLTAGY